MLKSLKQKIKLLIIIIIGFLVVIYPKEKIAVQPGILGDVAIQVDESDIEEIPLYFRYDNVTFTAYNGDGSINLSETQRLNDCLNSDGSGTAVFMTLTVGIKYVISGTNVFMYNNEMLNLEIQVEPILYGREIVFRVERGITRNYIIRVDMKRSKVDVTYKITNQSGQLVNRDFCYGFIDPDGGDYYYDNVLGSDIYYKPGANSYDTTEYPFAEGFVISQAGILLRSSLSGYDEGLILASNNSTSEFKINWETVRFSEQKDYLEMPYIYKEPSGVNIKVNMNGGFLKSEHGNIVGSSGEFVSVNNRITIHSVEYDENINLVDYNDASYINIGKVGYTAVSGQEYYLIEDGGTRRYFNQAQTMSITNIASNTGMYQSVTMYVNWVPNNYTISYTLNGGTNSALNPQSYTVESSDIEIVAPTKTGSTFKGWRKTISNLDWKTGFLNYRTGVEETNNTYPKANFTSPVSLKEGVTYTLSGYGTYDTSQIRWRFYSPSGSYLGSSEGTSVTPTEDCYARILFVVESTESQRHGLTITASEDDDSVIIPAGSTGNVTLIAQWTPNTAMVTIRKNYSEWTDWENSGYKVALYQGGVEKYSYAAGTKSGGTITWSGVVEGYYDIYASKNSAQPSTLVDTQDNVIVNGQNSEYIDYYNVTLYRGTGIDSVSGAGIYLYLQDVTIDATVKTGYTWAHWTNCDCGEGTCYCNPCNCDVISTDKQYTFQQSWDIITRTAEATLTTYTINYNLDGGIVSGTNPTSYTIEDNTITLINPTKAGYTFSGWTGTGLSSNTMTVTIPHGSTGNRSYVAHWTANTATITIKKDNANWAENNGIKVELRQGGTTKYSGTASSSLLLFNGVLPGTYDIYASKSLGALTTVIDTGTDIVMTDSGSATINYYTLILNKGTGISAVIGGGTYLKNQTANIDATVSTGYTWEGWSVISGDSPD